MNARIKFSKTGAIRYIGHLDLMRCFQKALRRSAFPIAFTAGYSPHMVMSFAAPLGVGLISQGEYLDIELSEPITPIEAISRLNSALPDEIRILSFRVLDDKEKSGMAEVAAADYRVSFYGTALPGIDIEKSFLAFLAQPSIVIEKETKRSSKVVDIKPMILEGKAESRDLFLKVLQGSRQNLNPALVAKAFFEFLKAPYDRYSFLLERVELYKNEGDEERPLLRPLDWSEE